MSDKGDADAGLGLDRPSRLERVVAFGLAPLRRRRGEQGAGRLDESAAFVPDSISAEEGDTRRSSFGCSDHDWAVNRRRDLIDAVPAHRTFFLIAINAGSRFICRTMLRDFSTSLYVSGEDDSDAPAGAAKGGAPIFTNAQSNDWTRTNVSDRGYCTMAVERPIDG